MDLSLPVKIKVKANKHRTEIIGKEGSVYVVHVKAPAEKNKANLELIKFFSQLTGKKVNILRGKTSRRKLIG